MLKPAIKAVLIVFGIAIVVQMLPAYYRYNEFDYYVKRHSRSATSEHRLKRELMLKAHEYSLPVREQDIDISTTGRTYRVAVNYTIPINLILFSQEMKFKASGAGWLPRPLGSAD
jgi:hypothetical protein